MLKLDRFSCSQKIWLKQDPPVYMDMDYTPIPRHINRCIIVYNVKYS